MTAGRPAFYTTNEELQSEIDRYFIETEKDDITITGLALFLGFTSRQALINYQEKPEFVDTIKRAKLKVENAYEKRLIARGNGGDVFALKNFEWTDKQEFQGDFNNKNFDVGEGMSPEQKLLIAKQFIKNNGQEATDGNGEG